MTNISKLARILGTLFSIGAAKKNQCQLVK